MNSILTSFLLYPNTSSRSGVDSIHHWILSSYLALRGALPPNDAATDFPSGLFMAYDMKNGLQFVLPTLVIMSLEAAAWHIGPFRAGALANVTLGKIPKSTVCSHRMSSSMSER